MVLAKPTDIAVTNSSGSIVSYKWADYDRNTGNLSREELCRSDNPETGCARRDPGQNMIVDYEYSPEGNLWKTTDPKKRILPDL